MNVKYVVMFGSVFRTSDTHYGLRLKSMIGKNRGRISQAKDFFFTMEIQSIFSDD